MAKFKTRARALDMLGRQQIAGIPNAINELFKNAHDAYAERVVADYFRQSRLFVLRDDGIGMSEHDFRNKWLTLGTESKVLDTPYVPPNRSQRQVLGEKGIGRLSIAAIGSQVTILTRACRNDIFSDLVCAYIHWGIFECPGIDLDEIEIPVKTFPEGQIPTKSDIDEMLSEFAANVSRLRGRNHATEQIIDRILSDVALCQGCINPARFSVDKLSLKGDGKGTHFYIMPADESLDAAIDERAPGMGNYDRLPPLQSYLLGFSNTMKNANENDVIWASFFDHEVDGSVRNLIGTDDFFTSDEFSIADHHIEGHFDEYGQFNGNINIYGKKTYENHIITWQNTSGAPTECGPFRISLAIIQPELKKTNISADLHAKLWAKTKRLGGVYIYKDEIRILPYGSFDYDWLGIEYRRTKSASYYFFSHRNLFGYVDISQNTNNNLREKAGREGFRENKAYRQLRDILTNFLLQLTADFFRDDSINPEWNDYSAANERRYKTLSQREKRLKGSKEQFIKDIDNFFKRVHNDDPQKEATELLNRLAEAYRIAIRNSEYNNIVTSFIEADRNVSSEFDAWRSSYEIKRPKDAAFKKSIEEDWLNYQNVFNGLDNDLFQPTRKQLERVAKDAQTTYEVLIDQRQRFEASLNDLIRQKEQESTSEGRAVRKTVVDFQKKVSRVVKDSLAEVQRTTRDVMSEFSRADLTILDDSQQVEIKLNFEDRVTKIAASAKDSLVYIREQLQGVSLNPGEEPSVAEEVRALEAEYLALREEKTKDIELMQMGQAVSVIQHEFNSQVMKIRDNIHVLKSWADLNAKLQPVYGNLRTSFEHLDGYLNLFAPLQRRMRRSKEDVYGHEIVTFLSDLFKNRFERHDIELKVNLPFKSMKQLSYRSVFYPVFVNLIDNAIFWLKDQSLPRIISLDYRDHKIFIKDNGPGVSLRDVERIFEPGFSRKPGGAGLGLYIVREALKGVDCAILVLPPTADKGACFVINTKQDGSL
jgi:signal transduction histidine kinase